MPLAFQVPRVQAYFSELVKATAAPMAALESSRSRKADVRQARASLAAVGRKLLMTKQAMVS